MQLGYLEDISNRTGQRGLKAVILGSTGAIGKILVKELCSRSSWTEITVIARRSLPEWKTMNGAEKIKVIQMDSLDDLEEINKWNKFAGYDSFFCTLGSRTGNGKETFYKVDFTYCLWGAQIAELNKIPHFSLISCGGASKNSCFLYLRTKGEVSFQYFRKGQHIVIEIEEAIKKLNFQYFSIFRPGLLINRQNDYRCDEKFFQYCCCCIVPNIESLDFGRAMILDAENKFHGEQFEKVICYEHRQIKNMIL